MAKMFVLHNGDLVTPSVEYVGSGHIFEVKNVDNEKKLCQISLFKENEKHGKCTVTPETVLYWNFLELDLIRTIESMDKEWYEKIDKNLNQIKKETAEMFINEKRLPDAYMSRSVDNVACKSTLTVSDMYPNLTITRVEGVKAETTNKNEGELNMFKILEMYKDNERKKIKEQCNERKKSIIEDDQVQLIAKEMENQIKAIVGEKSEAYCFDYRGLYEDRTERALQELDEETDKKLKVLYKKIENIQALLELAPNYEEKIKILRDYEIMDRKKNIIL